MNTAVVGGGVIGLAIALECLQNGIETTIIRPDEGDKRASWSAAGMLAPVAEATFGEDVVLKFNLASHAAYRDWTGRIEAQSGRPAGLEERGTLILARDSDDLAAISRLHEFICELGLDAERIDARKARELEPALSARLRGGVWIERDHHVDPRLLLNALELAVRQSGGQFLEMRADQVSAQTVRSSDGSLREYDEVVVAAGAETGLLMRESGFEMPIEPVKGQSIRLLREPSALCPSMVLRGLEAYIVPRANGEIVIGASSEDKGWDTRPTAGVIRDLLEHAAELVPGLDECEIDQLCVALRPASPDRRPVIGRLIDGPCVAAGHYRHGILMAPATAQAVVSILTTGAPTDVAQPFAPGRLEGVIA